MINKGGFGVDGAPFFCGKFLITSCILTEVRDMLFVVTLGIRGMKIDFD